MWYIKFCLKSQKKNKKIKIPPFYTYAFQLKKKPNKQTKYFRANNYAVIEIKWENTKKIYVTFIFVFIVD